MGYSNRSKVNLKQFWENPIFWDYYSYSIEDKVFKDRLTVIKNMIPQGIKTVVDVGCGNGNVIKEIDAEIKIALDISETALRSIKDETIIKVVADITDDLPIEKNIDLLICLEVLEHFPEDDFKKAVENILKKEPNFLLIGVPYKERLEERSFRCHRCGQVFHADIHFRSFNDKMDIVDLFKEKYVLYKEAYIGYSNPRLFPAFYSFRNKYVSKIDEFVVCYHCGNKFVQNDTISRKFIRHFINKIERLISPFAPKYPGWMIVFLKNKYLKNWK